MQIEPMRCATCGKVTQHEGGAGLTYCTCCFNELTTASTAESIDSPPGSEADAAADRSRWKRCFWLAFFLAPVSPPAAAAGATFLVRRFAGIENATGHLLGPISVLGSFSLIVFCCSYCLLRCRNETFSRADAMAHLIVQAIGIAPAAITILVGGCSLLSGFSR